MNVVATMISDHIKNFSFEFSSTLPCELILYESMAMALISKTK